MAYETALQERQRHDAERAADNLDRQKRQEASSEGDDVDPSPIRIEQFDLVYSDFTINADNGRLSTPLCELKSGEQLLWCTGRLTEVFDDLQAENSIFVLVSAISSNDSQVIGFGGNNFSIGTLAESDNDVIDLQGSSVGSNSWSSLDSPYTPEAESVQLYLQAILNGDGTQGAVTVWLYIGTP